MTLTPFEPEFKDPPGKRGKDSYFARVAQEPCCCVCIGFITVGWQRAKRWS